MQSDITDNLLPKVFQGLSHPGLSGLSNFQIFSALFGDDVVSMKRHYHLDFRTKLVIDALIYCQPL
jgi:hypothetical protein